MSLNDWNLNFFNTGEWQVCDERLADVVKSGERINPSRSKLFRPLRELSPGQVTVAVFGQDPYPQHDLATGLAFSVGDNDFIPPTLNTILKEYESDLGLPLPNHGNLEPWVKEGVLLWNVIPSCTEGHSLSHDWPEWQPLTAEICDRLSAQGVVFLLLGSKARAYASLIDKDNNVIIETSHPSPRGSLNSKTPFKGSKIFSRANEGLIKLGKDPITWKL